MKTLQRGSMRVLSGKVRYLVSLGYTLILASLVAILLLYTAYAPDTWVFVKYAHTDNYQRSVGLYSLLNNTVIFDLLTMMGDALALDSRSEYLRLITVVTLTMFGIKYLHYCKSASFFGITLLFVTSLITYDLNQLRFNLSLLLLLYSFRLPKGNRLYVPMQALSGLAHILPMIVFYCAKLYYLPLLVLPALLVLLEADGSRFVYYFQELGEIKYYKVLVLTIPNIIVLWHCKSFGHKSPVSELAQAFVVISIVFMPFNQALAARFVEGAYYILVLWWVTKGCQSKVIGGMFLSFSSLMLISRLLAGVYTPDSVTNFMDE
jgi:hypothetical protein